MKAIIFTCLFFLASAGLYAQQDSSKIKPPRTIFFHVTNGINLLQSEQLRARCGTKALYFWGAGVRVGNPDKDMALLALDYNQSSYKVRGEVNNQRVDSLLRMDQAALTVSFRMIEGKEFAVRAHTGFMLCFLTDDLHKLKNDEYQGFKIGLGLERKCFTSQYVHFYLDYDLMRPSGEKFRDYDVVKLGIGIYL
jgi:hypothetical protein